MRGLGCLARVGVSAVILMIVMTNLNSPWSVLIQAVFHPQRTVDSVGPDVLVLGLCTALLQILCSWLLVIIALTGVQILPGSLGFIAQKLAHRIAPRLLRTMAAAALGLTLLPATAYAAESPALISTTVAISTAVPDVDWPQSPDPQSNNPETTAQITPPLPSPPASSSTTVQAGDCLWTIAAAALGPGAATAQISALTDAIYEANSALIGPNPDLVIAGQALIIPT